MHITSVSVEINISIYCLAPVYELIDDEIDRKIDVSAMQFLLVQNRHQTHDWTLIGSGANGIGMQVWHCSLKICRFEMFFTIFNKFIIRLVRSIHSAFLERKKSYHSANPLDLMNLRIF